MKRTIQITYFVHGTTPDNEKDLFSGQNQVKLSELGVKQLMDLKKILDLDGFDFVFTSDLPRAVQSAELVFKGKVPIIKDKRLRECDTGDWTGRPFPEIRAEMPKRIDIPFPNGESYNQVERRMREFVVMLNEKYNGKNVAIVAHQAPQFALDVILKGMTWKEAMDNDWRIKKKWQPGWKYEA